MITRPATLVLQDCFLYLDYVPSSLRVLFVDVIDPEGSLSLKHVCPNQCAISISCTWALIRISCTLCVSIENTSNSRPTIDGPELSAPSGYVVMTRVRHRHGVVGTKPLPQPLKKIEFICVVPHSVVRQNTWRKSLSARSSQSETLISQKDPKKVFILFLSRLPPKY